MIYFLIMTALVGLDQLTKFKAVKYLKPKGTVHIFGNTFKLSYVENRGAAFGILQNKQILFLIISIVVIGFLIVFFLKEHKNNHFIINIILSIFLAGSIGNFIDRLRLGYVVDFISVYNFPVFNIADMCIVIASFLLIVILVFFNFDEVKI